MLKDKYFKIAHAVILFLLIIFLGGQIPYFTGPLTSVMGFILLPLVFGVFLYYLIRPLLYFLQKWIKNKTAAIIVSYLIVICIIAFIFYFGGSIIYEQGRELTASYSYFYNIVMGIFERIRSILAIEEGVIGAVDLRERIFSYLDEIAQRLSNYNYMGIFSSITNFGLIILLIPFVLFYFLKDDQKIFENIMTLVPENKKRDFEKLAVEIDKLLSTFISSQLLIAVVSGIILFFGFLIIGLPNSFSLAVIATVSSLIPIIGTFFGSLPAVFVALTISWIHLLGVLGLMAIVQYLEGNIIRPIIQGRSLEVHPIVVLFSVLAGAYLFGVIGALTAVPLYVVLRLILRKKYIDKEI